MVDIINIAIINITVKFLEIFSFIRNIWKYNKKSVSYKIKFCRTGSAQCKCHSGRAVGRVMGIGKNTIWGWLREYNEKLISNTENNVEIAEMDTYIKKDQSVVSNNNNSEKRAYIHRF